MKPVICFGEALIDFLNTSKEYDGQLELCNYRQYPGGAPANVAVAVAKLGGNALFAGQVGNDSFGNFLESSLQAYNVNTQFLHKHSTAKTPLAFVTLDQDGERSFSFRRDQTADVIFKQEQVDNRWFADRPIVHFCSNTLTDDNIASCTEFVVNKALSNNAIVSFDVNLRHNLWSSGQANINKINRLAACSHLLKLSYEELEYLAEGNIDQYIEWCLSGDCQLLIVTNGAKKILGYSATGSVAVEPYFVNAIDTTAAGDAFVGGLLYALSHFDGLNKAIAEPHRLIEIIRFAAACGAISVTRSGAFPALATFKEVSHFFQQHDTAQPEFLTTSFRANDELLR